MENSNIPENNNNKYFLAEYEKAQDFVMHYDNFQWEVGAVLIAGTFVFWGFILDKASTPAACGLASVLISLLMSCWLLYCSHNRQYYIYKLHRIYEIEKMFGFKQHLRFKTDLKGEASDNAVYQVFGPRGHKLIVFIYLVVSFGAPLISIIKTNFNLSTLYWFFPTVIICIIVYFWNKNIEKKLKSRLEEIKKQIPA